MRGRLPFGAFLGVLCLIGAGAARARAQAVVDDSAVIQADHDFASAVARSDGPTLESLLDADFTWTDANGRTISRAQVVAHAPQAIIPDESAAKVAFRSYGQVEFVHAQGDHSNVMRIWVKRPEGWRQLVYQEVQLTNSDPVVAPDPSSACENPCKTLPYDVKSKTEQDVLTAFMALQTAAVAHDSATCAKYVAEEFVAASSNSNKVLDKQGRMDDLDRGDIAGFAPTPAIRMQLYDFPGVTIVSSRHQPIHGKPLHVTRIWIKRSGKWMEAASWQTIVSDAPAAP